jgi:hypothetical protein
MYKRFRPVRGSMHDWMQRIPMRIALKTIIALIITFGSLTSSGVAHATPPPSHEFVSDPAWFQQFAWNVDCGSFNVNETALSGRWNKTTYFDAEGNPTIVKEHYTFYGVLANSATGETVADRWSTNFKFLIIKTPAGFDYDVYTASGRTFHFTVPGEGLTGPTLVGRYIYSTYRDVVFFSAGLHPDDVFAFEQFDPSMLCGLLS